MQARKMPKANQPRQQQKLNLKRTCKVSFKDDLLNEAIIVINITRSINLWLLAGSLKP